MDGCNIEPRGAKVGQHVPGPCRGCQLEKREHDSQSFLRHTFTLRWPWTRSWPARQTNSASSPSHFSRSLTSANPAGQATCDIFMRSHFQNYICIAIFVVSLRTSWSSLYLLSSSSILALPPYLSTTQHSLQLIAHVLYFISTHPILHCFFLGPGGSGYLGRGEPGLLGPAHELFGVWGRIAPPTLNGGF